MTKIDLKYPIELGGKNISNVSIRRPKVRDTLDMLKQEGNEAAKEVWLFATLCSVEEAVIHELDMMDYDQLQEVYASFLPKTKKVGK